MAGLAYQWMVRAVLALLVLQPLRAQESRLVDGGFERLAASAWDIRYGGEGGGHGGARMVQDADKARSGRGVVWLAAEAAAHNTSHAWASVSQMASCHAGAEMAVSVWVRQTSSHAHADVQLRAEFFEDAEGRLPVVQRIRLLAPADGGATNTWRQLRAADRVPDRAQFVRISIVLLVRDPGRGSEQVWVDDIALRMTPRPGRHP